jgi:glycosyltransferase involved in cell wall biosynthesis
MRIIFDLRKVGLGNNGGSLTLIRSGNALVDLGHEVIFIDSFKNMHTWSDVKFEHVVTGKNFKPPSGDFIIATGYKSVLSTVASPKACGIKCHWIRAWETWQMPESQIVNKILKAPTIKFVNSLGLQQKLLGYKTNSHIVKPGYDLDEIYPVKKKKNEYVVIGGLYHKKHSKIKRVEWLFSTYSKLKSKDYPVKLYLLGAENPPKLYDKYLKQPTMKEKNDFYNEIDIWLSPATQEGLHMPPAEAMMAGCPVVGTDAELAGTDYLIHNHNGLISENNLDAFVLNTEKLITDENLRKELGKNSRSYIVSLGNRKHNMSKFIELLETLR